MEQSTKRQVVDLQGGLFIIKYESAEVSDRPPKVMISVDPASEGAVDLILPPTAEGPTLWSPGASMVARSMGGGRLRVTVAPSRPNGSTAARVQVIALSTNAPAGARAPADAGAPEGDAVDLDLTSFRVLGHVAGIGDVFAAAGTWIAGPMAPSRIEGIAIEWPAKPTNFSLRYTVRVGGQRPVTSEPVEAGTFAGTRGRSLPLLGATLEISGGAARGHQLSVEAIFLGSPQMRAAGQRVVLSGPTGQEPLVGLRAAIVPIEYKSEGGRVPSSAAAPVSAKPAKPAGKMPPARVRVFRSASTGTAKLPSEILFSRLAEDDIHALMEYLKFYDVKAYDRINSLEQAGKRFEYVFEVLRYGNHYLRERFSKSRMSSNRPPEDVLQVGRTDAYCGDLFFCDLISGTCSPHQIDLNQGSYLDFGCASGRIVRNMAAAYPASKWYGCDPNRRAIDWARTAFPDIQFYTSSQSPPLEYPNGTFDGAFACAIWTHFSRKSGVDWMNEMLRVIKPGGWLLFTTSGPGLIERDVKAEQRKGLRNMVQASGFGYWGAFKGKQLHLDTSDWGYAFATPEWVRQNLIKDWRELSYRAERNQRQDVFLIQKAGASPLGAGGSNKSRARRRP
jgi:SAM-dependent methyltransferase